MGTPYIFDLENLTKLGLQTQASFSISFFLHISLIYATIILY